MHHEKQGAGSIRCRRILAAALPAVGIMALAGCIQQFSNGWLSTLSENYLMADYSLSYENETSGTEISTTAAEEDAVVTFASNDLSQSPQVLAVSTVTGVKVKGCGLYIDGEFYGAYSSSTTLHSILESFKTAFTTGTDGENVSFSRDIQLVDGTYSTSDMLTYSGLKSVLESTTVSSESYTVEKGDTVESIAKSFDMETEAFKKLNSGISTDKLIAGETLTVSVEEPLIQVICTRQITETVEVPYETEIVESTSSSGKGGVITEGKNGKKVVTESIVTVNGKETEKVILSETVLVEPVTRQVTAAELTGTTYSASYYGDTGSGVLSESMIWPLPNNGGTVTCSYGEDDHHGLDLAASAGTDIYAAASGKVVVAGVYYTYGNCVVIDHGNGVRTLYAHCSSLNVSVGDEVSQGDVIGQVGMTGYATGNHLHFEVHVNNRTYDPYNFISREE